MLLKKNIAVRNITHDMFLEERIIHRVLSRRRRRQLKKRKTKGGKKKVRKKRKRERERERRTE